LKLFKSFMKKLDKSRAPGLIFRFYKLIAALIFWNVAIRIIILLRILGSHNEDIATLSKGFEFFQKEIFWSTVVVSLYVTISWLLAYVLFEKKIRRFANRRIFANTFLIDIIVFLLMGLALGIIHYTLEKDMPLGEAILRIDEFLFNPTVLFFFISTLTISFFFQLLQAFSQQIGKGAFWKLLSGYYHQPREVEKIFLFVDLESSTRYAEELGHRRYSDFIQECFRLLTDPVILTRARIFQYVGDQVVITWDAGKPSNFSRAVDFFFLFLGELEKQKSYFEKKYKLSPVFTASLNAGKVMAVEVGEIKHELAYHGDVLNTAARIQKQCKQYHKPLLATEDFVTILSGSGSVYPSKFIEEVILDGKGRPARIYEICPILNKKS